MTKTPPVLLDVVGCRVGRQLSFEVMVHKARLFAVELVSLCPICDWLTLGSLQSVDKVEPSRFLLKGLMLFLMSTSSISVEIAFIFVQALWTTG